MAQTEDRGAMIRRVLAETAPPPPESRSAMLRRVLAETEPSVSEYAANLPKAALSGAMQFGGEALRGIGRAADTIREIAPWTTALDVGSGESAFTAAGEAVSGAAPAVDPRVAESLPGRIASGLGQVTAMGATALASPATALGGAMFGGVSDMDRRIADADISESERALYMLGGGAVAGLEMVPVTGLLARLNKVSGGATVSALRKMVEAGTLKASAKNVAETTLLEGLTEQGQAELVNALVAHATDEDYQALQDWKEGAAGGGVGALLGTAVEIATGKRRRLLAVAAERNLPIAEARERYASDPAFRAEVDGDQIAAAFAEAQARAAETGVTDLAAETDQQHSTGSGDFETDAERWRRSLLAEPEAGGARRVRAAKGEPLPENYSSAPYVAAPAPGGLSEAEVVEWNAREAQKVQAALSAQAQGFEPSTRGSSVEYASVPRNPAVAPSSAALQAIPGQSGPQGQPVYPITGTSAVDEWGGTRDNVIGAKAPMRLEDVGGSLVKAAEAMGVHVERIVNDLGQPVLGVFRPGGVIQATPEQVTELAHEVGHALHRVLMQQQRSGAAASADWDSALTGLPTNVQGDLRRLGTRQATGQPGRELTEGMAEMVRLWVTAPEKLSVEAPQAKAWLEGWMLSQPRAVRDALSEAQQRAHVWRFQGDPMRSRIAPASTAFGRTLTRARMLGENFTRVVYDEAYAADAVDRRMTEMGKGQNVPLRDIIRSMRGIARGLVSNWMNGRPSNFYGQHVQTPNFEAIVKRLARGEQTAFGDYLHARATLVREATGYDTGLAPAEAARKVELYDREKPHFQAVADSLQAWFAGVNQTIAQYSPTYAAEYARILAADAEAGIDFYVPLKRSFSEGKGGASKRALIETGEVSKRRTEGSSRAVINPLESLANEARVRFERAVYRNALETMVNLHDAALEGGNAESGLSPWIREVQPNDIKGVAADIHTEDGFEALADVLHGPKLTGERVFVRVRDQNGRRRVFSMDPKLAALAVTVDPLTLRQGTNALVKLLSFSRRGFVGATITYNPVFQFYTNLLYDIPTAYLTGKYIKPLDLVPLVGMTTRNVVEGALHSMHARRSAWVDTYNQLGLKSTTSSSSEFEVGRAVRGIKPRKVAIADLWDAFGVFMSVPQRAVQIALMQKAAKARGLDIANLDAEGAMILRLAARQPVDYTAGSSTSRQWQTVVPFLRAALEGQKQIGEAAKRNPVEFIAKLGVLSAGAAAAKWVFGDDELEASKSADERVRTISIPLGDGPDAEVLQWRIPNELAPLVMGPSLLIDAIRGQGGDPEEIGWSMLQAILPPTPLDNPLINTFVQQARNKQRPFKPQGTDGGGAPIVPGEMEGKEPLAQQGSQTAPVAVKAATAMDTALASAGLPPTHGLRQLFGSPVRVEAMTRSMLGGNAVSALEGYGFVPGLAPAREYEMGEALSGALRRGGMTSWDDPAIRALYEMDSQADMARRTQDGTSMPDPILEMRRQTVSETVATITLMRWLSTHEAEGMTVSGRRALARQAQVLARQAVKELANGGITTAYLSAAAIRQRREMHDISKGAYFK